MHKGKQALHKVWLETRHNNFCKHKLFKGFAREIKKFNMNLKVIFLKNKNKELLVNDISFLV